MKRLIVWTNAVLLVLFFLSGCQSDIKNQINESNQDAMSTPLLATEESTPESVESEIGFQTDNPIPIPNEDNTPQPEDQTPNNNESGTEEAQQQAINEFSVVFGDKYISLKDWDKDNYVAGILGKPIEETTKILGSGADTFAGTSVKTLKYQGLIITLFRGREYWITMMVMTDGQYQTYRGITIGSTVSELKQAYENVIQALDGRTDINNCAYTFNDQERYIWFEVGKGVIKEIKLYVEIP